MLRFNRLATKTVILNCCFNGWNYVLRAIWTDLEENGRWVLCAEFGALVLKARSNPRLIPSPRVKAYEEMEEIKRRDHNV